MTTLVTGGAGYIGSITARMLSATGRDVVVLDSLENGHAEAVTTAPLVVGNIADSSLVEQVCRDHNVDEVVHFAAYKAVGESMDNPGKYFDNNVTGSHKLIDTVAKCGVTRFVFSSSAAVYGTPASVPLVETMPLNCESVYAETKAMIERLLHWYSVTTPLRSVCLRYFNAAGAATDGTLGEDWNHSQNLMPVVMNAALGIFPMLSVFGDDYPTPDGTCIRDYIHVEDLAHAHVLALDYLGRGNDSLVCNVGTGRGTSVFEIIATTERVTGRKVPHQVASRRAGDPSTSYADVELARRILGFSAQKSLDDIISSAFNWHAQQL